MLEKNTALPRTQRKTNFIPASSRNALLILPVRNGSAAQHATASHLQLRLCMFSLHPKALFLPAVPTFSIRFRCSLFSDIFPDSSWEVRRFFLSAPDPDDIY